MRISVIGAGSWGTAVSWLLGGKGHEVRLWSRENEIADGINADHRNPMYLKDVVLTDGVFATPDVEEALTGAEAVVMVTPSMGVRTTAESMAGFPGPVPRCSRARGRRPPVRAKPPSCPRPRPAQAAPLASVRATERPACLRATAHRMS